MHRDVDDDQEIEVERSRRTGWQLALLLVLGGLLILFTWAGVKGWRIYSLSQSLLSRQAQAEALAANGFTQIDPDEAEALVNGLRSDVVALKREVDLFMPIATYLSWVPRYGPTLEAAPHLLEMADAGTEAAAYAMRGLKPAIGLLQDENLAESPLPGLVRILDSAEADLRASARPWSG